MKTLLFALALLSLIAARGRAQADDVADFHAASSSPSASDDGGVGKLSDSMGAAHPGSADAGEPGPEMKALEYFDGEWSCDGKVFAGIMGPDSHETAYKSSFKIEKDLGGFWYSGEYNQERSKDYPGNTSKFFWGYDPATKRYLTTGVDAAGAFFTSRSLGWDDDAWVNLGEGWSGGARIPVREVYTKKSSDEFVYHVELDLGHGFRDAAEDDCTRD